MGFTVRIANPPYWAVWWIGSFTDLFISSGALPIDEVWDSSDDPLGHSTLQVQFFDVDRNLRYGAGGLGPVYSGKDYEYNYATGTLYEIVPEEFAGRISRKQLEHNGTYTDIPSYDVPLGERGLVHVYGRNDTSISQKLGIWWMVFDPDGQIVETYSDWQAFSTGPGGEHHFIGDRFNLNKQGTYTIDIMLFMNQDSPVMVDEYYGTLCTVAIEEFRGSIITKELEYDGARGSIPVR